MEKNNLESNPQATYLRQIAEKINISQLQSGSYIQEDDKTPNYLYTLEGKKIFRINLIGIVVQKEQLGSIGNFLLDDGTGKVVTKFFEEHKSLASINIGDAVIIIGKVRVYNEEKYISPEIIKKIDCRWLKVRSKELIYQTAEQAKIGVKNTAPKDNLPKKTNNLNTKITPKTKVSEELIDNQELEILPIKKISKLIKELDKGEGVLIEDILEKSTLENTEKLIENMLEKGDIFQNMPGKVKVL